MGEKFELIHAVLCDDVRHEAGSGKAFYIGVFTDRIIGPTTPVLLERLALVFCVREPEAEKIQRFKISIDAPSGAELPDFEESSYESRGVGTHTLILQLLGIALTPGSYAARLILNGHSEFVYPFTVESNPSRFTEIQRAR
jgi:hypothetical protein